MDRSTVSDRVKAIIAAALDRDIAEITESTSLIDDLEAESIDFLDIRFRVETEFGIKIEDEELWQGFLLRHSDLVEEGIVTERGMDHLKKAMPDFRWDRLDKRIGRENLPRLITPRTVIEFLIERLNLERTEQDGC